MRKMINSKASSFVEDLSKVSAVDGTKVEFGGNVEIDGNLTVNGSAPSAFHLINLDFRLGDTDTWDTVQIKVATNKNVTIPTISTAAEFVNFWDNLWIRGDGEWVFVLNGMVNGDFQASYECNAIDTTLNQKPLSLIYDESLTLGWYGYLYIIKSSEIAYDDTGIHNINVTKLF